MKRVFLFGIVLVVLLLIVMTICYDRGRAAGEATGIALVEELERKIDSVSKLPPEVVTDTVVVVPRPEVEWRTRIIRDTVTAIGMPDPDRIRWMYDSLVNEQLAIYVQDSLSGTIFARKIGYRLFVPLKVQITDSVFVPTTVLVEKPIYKSLNGLYAGGGVGGGREFAWTAGVGIQNNKHRYGVEYLRFGDSNNWMVKYSYLIARKK